MLPVNDIIVWAKGRYRLELSYIFEVKFSLPFRHSIDDEETQDFPVCLKVHLELWLVLHKKQFLGKPYSTNLKCGSLYLLHENRRFGYFK